MRERSILRFAFGKATGFFYAVVASVVANLVFAYVPPHRMTPAGHDPAPPVAAVAPLPPPSPAAAAPAGAPPLAPAAPARMAGARPGPGSGGLY